VLLLLPLYSLPDLTLSLSLSACFAAGVNNLHGLPSILGAVSSAIVFAMNPDDKYDVGTVPHPEGQAGYQLISLAVTLALALISGTKENALFPSTFLYRNDRFTKTGSGQTWKRHSKKATHVLFLQASFRQCSSRRW
jgi:hypothetical protein